MSHSVKLYIFIILSVIFYANITIATEDRKTATNPVYIGSPASLIDKHFSSLEHYWDNMFNNRFYFSESASIRTKLVSENKQYVLVMELPGYDKSQIKVKIKANRLIITGGDTAAGESKKDKDSRDNLKQFNYVIVLNDDVDQNAISSNLKNGILTIILPRVEIKYDDAKEIPIK